MQTDIKRRVFLKGSVASGAVAAAVGAGLLTPQMVLAEWNKAAFESKTVEDAVKNLGLEGGDVVSIGRKGVAHELSKVSMGGLSGDSEAPCNFAGLKGLSAFKQAVDLTFPIGHGLIVTYCRLFVKSI